MRAVLKCLPPAVVMLAGLAAAALAQSPGERDLQALRFYIQQQDAASASAEIRRLSQIFPDWQPPERLEDLLVTSPSGEIDEIFHLIADGDYAAARAAIAQTRERFPAWQPPEAMLTLLTVSEAQRNFNEAIAGPDPGMVLRIVAQVPDLLNCERINNPWRVAEVLTAMGRRADAMATYRAVLATCDDIDDLTATVEKASEIATEEDLTALISTLRTRVPAETPRWTTLETRLRAGRGLAPPAEGPMPQAPARAASTPAPRATAATEAPAPTGGNVDRIRAAAARGDWAACLAASAGTRDPAAVYERGWCALNSGRGMEAIAAFRDSAAARLPAQQRHDALYGLALAYLAQGMTEEAARVAASAPLTQHQRLEVEAQIIDQRGVRAYQRGDFRRAIAFFDAHEALTGVVRRDLAILRAYARLNLGDRPGALADFQRLDRQFSSAETRRGLELAR